METLVSAVTGQEVSATKKESIRGRSLSMREFAKEFGAYPSEKVLITDTVIKAPYLLFLTPAGEKICCLFSIKMAEAFGSAKHISELPKDLIMQEVKDQAYIKADGTLQEAETKWKVSLPGNKVLDDAALEALGF